MVLSYFAKEESSLTHALQRLQPFAQNGLHSLDQLKKSLNTAVHESILILRESTPISPAYLSIFKPLTKLITYRKIEGNLEESRNDPELHLLAIEKAVHNDKITQSIELIQTLPDTMQHPFKNWLDHAISYQNSKDQIDVIYDYVNGMIYQKDRLNQSS